MNIDVNTRRCLIQLIGKAEGEVSNADLANPSAAVVRLGGAMLANAIAGFRELGVEPTEQGSGFGEWDCGAFIAANDVPVVMVALTDKFRAAFKAHLLRWHVAVLDTDTDVYQRKH